MAGTDPITDKPSQHHKVRECTIPKGDNILQVLMFDVLTQNFVLTNISLMYTEHWPFTTSMQILVYTNIVL